MKKRVLILIAEKTGSGHVSSANAIKDCICEKTENIEVIIFNAMKLLGKTGERMENSYNKLITKTPVIWKLTYEVTNIFNRTTNYLIYRVLIKRFKKLIEEVEPDLIISAHPMFNNSIIKAMKKLFLKIPFFVYIIDIVKTSKLWLSKKADITFCPTLDIRNRLLKKGFKNEKLLAAGFPVNKKFIKPSELKEKKYPKLKVLMVTPHTKNKKTLKFAAVLTENFNVDLTIITGNNMKQYNYLQKNLINKNIKTLKYVDDMPDKLLKSDVLLTKAGPNMMLEAVQMCVPVIITSYLLGQEEKNHKLITDNEYGFRCETIKNLKKIFRDLEKNNYTKLNGFRKNEFNSTLLDGADCAAEYIINYL